jgi:nitrogen PTS system EIIA component
VSTIIEGLKLTDCLQQSFSFIHPNTNSKPKLFAHIGTTINAALPFLGSNLISTALEAREKIGSTALGHGIAIPHARIDGLSRPIASISILKNPIKFDEHDNFADIIFTIIAPQGAAELYNDLLSEAVTQLQSKHIQQQLRQSSSSAEVYNAFIQQLR